MMKMYLYSDAHILGFFHRFYSANMVSGVRCQVSEKAEVFVYPFIKRQVNRVANHAQDVIQNRRTVVFRQKSKVCRVIKLLSPRGSVES